MPRLGCEPIPAGAVIPVGTATDGDMLYYDTGAWQLRTIGTAGQVLTVSGGLPVWSATPADAVSSVFGRTGAVTAQNGDYTAAQVGAIATTLMTANGDLITRAAGVPSALAIGSTGQRLTVVGGAPAWASTTITQTIIFIISGGGSAITTGSKGFIAVDYAATITAVTLLADQSGSIVVDIQSGTYSAFPTNSSICGAAKPTLSAAQKSQDTTLTGWTTSITAGNILEFIVDSASTVTQVTVVLTVTRSI